MTAGSEKPKLTVKQEKFAQAYIETGNASEAYRQAYNAEKSSPEAIWVNASKLLANAKVALRVAELQMQAQERHEVTVDMIRSEIDEARDMAKKDGKTSDMLTASRDKAKLYGLLVDKQQHTGNVKTEVAWVVPE